MTIDPSPFHPHYMAKILLINDDGVLSPGLACLADALSDQGKLTVVAPHQQTIPEKQRDE